MAKSAWCHLLHTYHTYQDLPESDVPSQDGVWHPARPGYQHAGYSQPRRNCNEILRWQRCPPCAFFRAAAEVDWDSRLASRTVQLIKLTLWNCYHCTPCLFSDFSRTLLDPLHGLRNWDKQHNMIDKCNLQVQDGTSTGRLQNTKTLIINHRHGTNFVAPKILCINIDR